MSHPILVEMLDSREEYDNNRSPMAAEPSVADYSVTPIRLEKRDIP